PLIDGRRAKGPTILVALEVAVNRAGYVGSGSVVSGEFSGSVTKADIFLDELTSDVTAFFPDNLSSLNFWLDADDASTITTSGTSVTVWSDKTSNGFDVSQSTPSLQPTYDPNNFTKNERPVIEFPGDQDLRMGNYTTSANQTIYMVAKVDVVGNNSQSLLSMDGANDFQLDAGNNSIFNFRARTTNIHSSMQGTLNYENVYYIYTYILDFDNNTASIYVNNSLINSVSDYNTALSATTTLYIGVNRGLNQMLNGKFAEVLIFNEALDSTNQTNIYNYLNDKWDIV
ncbi:MAG: LamG-like jellyroll fold domain-containing protein, partial [Pseudomonadota bacterium]